LYADYKVDSKMGLIVDYLTPSRSSIGFETISGASFVIVTISVSRSITVLSTVAIILICRVRASPLKSWSIAIVIASSRLILLSSRWNCNSHFFVESSDRLLCFVYYPAEILDSVI
jgi:hypothetical protein